MLINYRYPVIACLVAAITCITPREALAEDITVTNPHSGTSWYKGVTYNITWITKDISTPVNIDLMQAGKVITPITKHPIPATQANQGIHQWQVTPVLADGMYRVRVQTTNQKVTGISDPVQIKGPKMVKMPEHLGLPERIELTFPPPIQVLVLDIEKLCHKHASGSVYRQALNTNYQCGLTGSEWHTDYQSHFDWCMQQYLSGQPLQVVAREEAMWKSIKACGSYIAMQVQLTKVEVHDDCDNWSEGDWYISLVSTGTTAGSGSDFEVWPNRNSASNVDSGNPYYPNIENLLVLKGTSRLKIQVGVVDCDGSPGHVFWPLVGVPIPPSGENIWPYEQSLAESVNCSGEEEFWEISGGNDFLGYELLDLSPQQWEAGGNFKLVAGAQAIQQCGSGGPPYTAHVSVKRVFPKP